MKLRYEFEVVDMGDEICAVPVGENADEFPGVLKLNDVAGRMLSYIQESDTPEETFEKLCKDYPQDDKREIAQRFCDFLNLLEKEHLLLP